MKPKILAVSSEESRQLSELMSRRRQLVVMGALPKKIDGNVLAAEHERIQYCSVNRICWWRQAGGAGDAPGAGEVEISLTEQYWLPPF